MPNGWTAVAADLERRLQALEAAATRPAVERDIEVDLWAVDGVAARFDQADAALIAGASQGTQWQVALSDDSISGQDWTERAGTIAALGHPARLHLLQQIHRGVTSAAELADDPRIGTTGQLHHHLRVLTAGGWVQTTSRGQYRIPPARIVPLLCLLLASQ